MTGPRTSDRQQALTTSSARSGSSKFSCQLKIYAAGNIARSLRRWVTHSKDGCPGSVQRVGQESIGGGRIEVACRLVQ